MVTIKLKIEAAKAAMIPPVGPILGQYGIPGQKFCQDFNEETKNIEKDTLLLLSVDQSRTKSLSKRRIRVIASNLLRRCVHNKEINIRRVYQIAWMLSTYP
jgi:ribosomal protein L11